MTVEHDERRRTFIVRLGDVDAELAYSTRTDGMIDLQHTFVPPEARGRGIADALARAAFDWARASGRRIVPTCPFVRSWLEEHPAERDLVGPR